MKFFLVFGNHYFPDIEHLEQVFVADFVAKDYIDKDKHFLAS